MAKKKTIEGIESIIKEGGKSLKKSLGKYQPSYQDRRGILRIIPERNATQHVGAALINSGYSVFAEHPFGRVKEKKHLDLVVLKGKRQIRIEAKRFGNTGSTSAIIKDIRRIKKFKLNGDADKHYETKFGVILALSRDGNVAEWWKEKNGNAANSAKTKKKEWIVLKNLLTDAVSGEISLQKVAKNQESRSLLYSIFEL